MFEVRTEDGKLIISSSSFVTARRMARLESIIRIQKISILSTLDTSRPFAEFVAGVQCENDPETHKIG